MSGVNRACGFTLPQVRGGVEELGRQPLLPGRDEPGVRGEFRHDGVGGRQRRPHREPHESPAQVGAFLTNAALKGLSCDRGRCRGAAVPRRTALPARPAEPCRLGPGERRVFFEDMELEEAMAICQAFIDNGEPSVINVEKSEEFTAAFRSDLTREQDANASAVILNPKDVDIFRNPRRLILLLCQASG